MKKKKVWLKRLCDAVCTKGQHYWLATSAKYSISLKRTKHSSIYTLDYLRGKSVKQIKERAEDNRKREKKKKVLKFRLRERRNGADAD